MDIFSRALRFVKAIQTGRVYPSVTRVSCMCSNADFFPDLFIAVRLRPGSVVEKRLRKYCQKFIKVKLPTSEHTYQCNILG